MTTYADPVSGLADGELLDTLIEMSHRYGGNPDLVLAGGGNTSVKVGDRLIVKGSGTALADIGRDGFVALDRAGLQALLERDLGSSRDERERLFTQAVLAARVDGALGPRPSVEAVLHHLMPARYVVHLHATLVNQFGCCRDGAQLVGELGDDVLWIGLVDPGIQLAQTLRRALGEFTGRTGRPYPRAVIMQNHGLVISGDTEDDVRRDLEWLLQQLTAIRRRFAKPAEPENLPLPADAAARLVAVLAPALRGLLGSGEHLQVVTFDDSPDVLRLVDDALGREIAEGGPLTPDQIVYCRSFPLWFDPSAGEQAGERAGENGGSAAIVERLTAAVRAHEARHGIVPKVVLVPGLGMFTAGARWIDAHTTRLVYTDAIKVMTGARRMGGVEYLTDDFRSFIEHWEAESYRQKVATGPGTGGRMTGRVALVTGAAQGFGLEITRDLVEQGAHVVLADLNVDGVSVEAACLNRAFGEGRAIGVRTDVTSASSVRCAVHQVVRQYGGLDLLVSNAGVLRAESVLTQPERDFDLSTAVNYKGYYLCVQAVAPILATQHLTRPDLWSDIIQINSKSGLSGSKRNFAYAGSKFGGVGLTQSFALELVTDGIKVNSICPGNFFDGPLWSDPENGLFVQYLRTGKVPGARTAADVRAAYEAKVPMARGCTTPDVMTALYYLVEQRYETGQAVPVTGGQVMLH